jgi:NitT/TauT family transport system substrate-binding protein
MNVVSIASFVRLGDTGFLVPKDSGWTKPADMVGKTVVYTAGSLEGPFMVPFFRKNGIPLDRVSLLNVDASAKIGTYASGKADAVVSTVPFVLPLVAAARPSTGILFADFGMHLPGFGLVAQPATLKTRPEALRRFASIIAGAWTYILAGHEQEGVDAIMAARPRAPSTPAVMLAEIELYRPYFVTPATRTLATGLQSSEDWQTTIDDMVDAKVIPAGTRPADYFTNDFLDVAYSQKIVAGS